MDDVERYKQTINHITNAFLENGMILQWLQDQNAIKEEYLNKFYVKVAKAIEMQGTIEEFINKEFVLNI